MKSILKVNNMKNMIDVNSIRRAISNNEGVIACQIDLDKKEVDVVYDGYSLTVDKLVESIEDLGYTIL
ncbi:heavy-metal-associated domain-containing protein [Clostridium rectalis]|uniref:heavy-metal-associated domain-containing protein n=1 Tax=Clostridium rectalis TaxID=2040295 RepID=UPI000F634A66|nr:heavy-metal-associated domain-containing protein [Clostridium rectalis]